MERLKPERNSESGKKRRRKGDFVWGEKDFDPEDVKRVNKEAAERGVRSPYESEYQEFPREWRSVFAFFDSLAKAEIPGVVQPKYRGDRDGNEP